MAYRPSMLAASNGHAGHVGKLYGRLMAHEEQALAAPGGTLPWTREQPSYDGSIDRLMRFRRGEPVDIPYHGIPRWARPQGMSPAGFWYATVSPDDTITWRDDCRQWMKDNGCWD